jgi:hypothetical protein
MHWVAADTTIMYRTWIAAVVSVVVVACGSSTDGSASFGQVTAPPSVDGAAAAPSESATSGPGPEYDVYLAAVAQTLGGTRFEALPFEEPELFAATGLLLCERREDGVVEDDIIVEYLTDLTDGDPALADDDQLVLAGALMGAAETALCPNLK